MKYRPRLGADRERGVAPFTGAWIEIIPCRTNVYSVVVAPFTGAWIEIVSLFV